MLCCTCVFRLLGSLPAVAATRSPNSAMAAARIPSLSCKAGGSSGPQPNLPGGPHSVPGTPHPMWGRARLPQPDGRFPPGSGSQGRAASPPQTGHLGRVPAILQDLSHGSLTPTAQVSRE